MFCYQCICYHLWLVIDAVAANFTSACSFDLILRIKNNKRNFLTNALFQECFRISLHNMMVKLYCTCGFDKHPAQFCLYSLTTDKALLFFFFWPQSPIKPCSMIPRRFLVGDWIETRSRGICGVVLPPRGKEGTGPHRGRGVLGALDLCGAWSDCDSRAS